MDKNALVQTLEAYLKTAVTIFPLEVFMFIGSFVEEIIAPIPSPFVTTLAGSVAAARQYPLISLLVLALIGSAGKTVGAMIIYKIADIGEDVLVTRFGKLLGLSHENIEKNGSKLAQSKHNWIILTGLRAFPAMPSAPVSALCGLIKTPIAGYVSATFIGNTIRNCVYLYIGYSGVNIYSDTLQGLDTLESLFKIIILASLVGFVGWFYWKRRSTPAAKTEN